jgi:DNA repair exonuclease SbcCD ATPase subunit
VTWIALAKVQQSINGKAEVAAENMLSRCEKKVEKCAGRITDLESKVGRARTFISACKEFISKMKKRTEEVNPYCKLIKDAKASIQQHRKKIEQLRLKRDKRKKTLLYYDFWKRGFGPNGIRSYILDAVNPVLNRIANIYLDFLMEGTMSVTLRTVRQKKDGSYSDKFEVVIENTAGADTMGGSCDNELSAVDFSLNLAMSDILESRIQGGFGFLFVDQALDAFDTVRSGKAVQLLKQKLNKVWCEKNKIPHKRSIWVITHKEQLKGLFENKILVEKRGGVCRIVR